VTRMAWGGLAANRQCTGSWLRGYSVLRAGAQVADIGAIGAPAPECHVAPGPSEPRATSAALRDCGSRSGADDSTTAVTPKGAAVVAAYPADIRELLALELAEWLV
jgi:hypothetical protein